MAELCWVYGWISKAKCLWKWPWKNSGPLDHFRIEDKNFEGFWSISQLLFIRFGKRVVQNVPTAKLFSIVKKFFCLLQYSENWPKFTNWLFLTTYPPALTFSMVWTLTNSGYFWTTYLPGLVNVVCERPPIYFPMANH